MSATLAVQQNPNDGGTLIGRTARRAAASAKGSRLVVHICFLCLGTAIPLLGIVGGSQWNVVTKAHRDLETSAISRAQTVAAAIDRELVGLTSALEVLGSAASLERGDLPTFGRMVAGVAKRTGVVPILRSADGTSILNPFFPTGGAVPERIFDVDAAALSSGQVQVTGFFMERATDTPSVALEIAVRNQDQPSYLLGIAVPIERLRQGVALQAEKDWTVSVVDGRGALIFSSASGSKPGEPATVPVEAASQRQGILMRDQDGKSSVTAFAHTQRSAWTVTVETSRSAYEAPLNRSIRFFGLTAGAAVLLSLFCAFFASRRLARSLGSLADKAQAVGRGETVKGDVPIAVAEVDEAARALDGAADEVRRRIEAEERAAEAGKRVLSTFESIGECVVVIDGEGRFTYLNSLARESFAHGRDVIGGLAAEIFPPSNLPGLKTMFAKARILGVMQRGEICHVPEKLWFETTVVPTEEGHTVFLRNVTERRLAAENRELMVRELHHRVKNTLATVQAIASTSARTAENLVQFRDAFADRIVSLSRTHTLLREASWEHVDLRQLVSGELAAYEEHGRVAIEGDELQLKSGMAMALGMAMHELTTNAVKHGALSNGSGRIAVSWSVTEEADQEPRLKFYWTESDGPAVSPPRRKGFGTHLLGKMIARQFHATIDQDWHPTGMRLAIDTPLGA